MIAQRDCEGDGRVQRVSMGVDDAHIDLMYELFRTVTIRNDLIKMRRVIKRYHAANVLINWDYV